MPDYTHSGFANDLKCALKSVGFKCGMCGECCRINTPDSNLIIISAEEIREIMDATGKDWDEVAEPYPDMMEEEGVSYTFDWCIRRDKTDKRSCVFQGTDNRCTIYPHRPWICRTYPLMLTDKVDDKGRIITNLIQSECLCYKNKISDAEAEDQVCDLICRKDNEDREFMKIKKNYENTDFKELYRSGIRKCVIDSEGVKNIG